ncbi:MAG TPA: phosphonate C-P lyase system protein PhnG [Dehalococcoidia bacterium]|nr:phosphonate C-P lyase system protein PhnG [Dehalococcoidia bacterium]
MEREERLEAISYAEREILEGLADRVLEDLAVEVSRGPSVGLLMVRGEEPSERLQFNFSEVTVSEAEVTANGRRGYAMVMGRQPEKALAGAVLDVALELGHPASDDIEAVLTAALASEDRRRRSAVSAVAGTRVQFEEMKPT